MELKETAARLSQLCMPDLEEAFAHALHRWGEYCESPIETLLLTAMTFTFSLHDWSLNGDQDWPLYVLRDGANGPPSPEKGIVLVPQCKWSTYRIDFAIFVNRGLRLCVECDGHDFHERTAEQAERDRRRDREMLERLAPVIRFTGREIYRDPFACAPQVINLLAVRLAQ